MNSNFREGEMTEIYRTDNQREGSTAEKMLQKSALGLLESTMHKKNLPEARK